MAKQKEEHVIVSGAKPSGKLHIANFAGSILNWLKMQNGQTKSFFFVADLHQMAESYDAHRNRDLVFDMAANLLALGIDPEKCTLFVQSDVPEHTELAWIFTTLTPVSFLERMTQYKDKSRHQPENVNAGLMHYPVLMAADILMYKGDRIPVGRDQVQHVELTRDIAGFFNRKFGATFPEPQPLFTETPKLRSLSEPLKKMSKSLGERSYIALTDEPDEIYEKVKRAVTETTGILSLSEEELEHRMTTHANAHADEESLRGMAGVWNLLTLLKLFGDPKEAERIIAAQPIKYGELKKLVAARIGDYFAEFRKKRAAYDKKPSLVWDTLSDGAKRARAVAKKTMAEVRERTGLR